MEGTDRVSGQLSGDKECPFSGITKSGRVWRKVLESGAQSVRMSVSQFECVPVYSFKIHKDGRTYLGFLSMCMMEVRVLRAAALISCTRKTNKYHHQSALVSQHIIIHPYSIFPKEVS